ncbi:MAG: beta-xylosidase [Acidobacteriaceae bacterium]|nr:beta-xylosidase [Acidobacteriaceae bacterium]MBV9764525.1 beta-xylosidase [Acidobacteriaceae bacterium]
MRSATLILLCQFATIISAQQTVEIRVDASEKIGSFRPVWNYFGYDEPNYTYTKNGAKLIHELAASSQTPVHIRTHNLLTTGNGTPALKFGSTDAYTEDSSGKPVYDWRIVDRILQTYVQSGAKPFVEIGFMPKALSMRPDPYVPIWKPGDKFDRYYVGWSHPPNSYEKWGDLVYEWVKHSVGKYGKSEVESWNWEVWNEPNIAYWHGTPDEYNKLYDYTAEAVKRALPSARIGGPGSTSPRDPKAAAFLKQFLEHCSSGKNYATQTAGAPLDFISFHAKGQPEVFQQHVRMSISQEIRDVSQGFAIVGSFEKFRNLPIVLTEADPDGCAACSARVYPQNGYRNGTLYPAYEAAAMKSILELADRNQVNLLGVLTWAFEFEDQPYFAGFRTLATNGVDKPVLNFFRMAGLMNGERVQVQSAAALGSDAILASGVRDFPDIDALATRSEHKLSIMVWSYQDEDTTGPVVPVNLSISALPSDAKRLLLRHYRIDQDHSNAFTAWKQMGSPQNPTAEEQSKLEASGQLQLLESPRWIDNQAGSANIRFTLPREAISLIELSW